MKFITKNGKKIPVGKKGALPKAKLSFDEDSLETAKASFIERGMPSNVAEAQLARNHNQGSAGQLDLPEIILRDKKVENAEKCSRCKGQGSINRGYAVNVFCSKCNGTGKVLRY